jgi:hypothetical protein
MILKITFHVPDEKQEFIEKANLIASVLDESLSYLIATYLESYVKSHSEELRAIQRLPGRLERGDEHISTDESCKHYFPTCLLVKTKVKRRRNILMLLVEAMPNPILRLKRGLKMLLINFHDAVIRDLTGRLHSATCASQYCYRDSKDT